MFAIKASTFETIAENLGQSTESQQWPNLKRYSVYYIQFYRSTFSHKDIIYISLFVFTPKYIYIYKYSIYENVKPLRKTCIGYSHAQTVYFSNDLLSAFSDKCLKVTF